MRIDRTSPRARPAVPLVLLALALGAQGATAQESEPSFDEAIAGLERRDGFLELYVDRDNGRVLLALPAPADDGTCARMLYAGYLAAGLGSNPVNLDRGQQGHTLLLAFRRVGARVLIEAENWGYVARDASPAERRAVRDSFASSTLWGARPLAVADDGRQLIDLTGFLLEDRHGAAARLGASGQGSWSLDADTSAFDPGSVLVFEDNVELGAQLGFTASDPGREVRGIAPDPRRIRLAQHVSLLRLPGDGYTPRRADPRTGVLSLAVQEYAGGLAEPVGRLLAARHRLIRTDPTAERSTVERPIVYWLDPGTPEPVRSALLDGAAWWAAAFEAAGFVDAFRVEPLPEGVHPLDARYNVIHWVHRATRGWSYGGFVADPRTGEIVRGNVLLGSLRVRQDRMIFEGLVGADRTGRGGPDDPLEAALARIRQLAAHEVGHAIGLAHNMAASTQARASVMDYPAPHVGIDDDGELTLGDAYAVGVGAWDRFAIEALYGDAPIERIAADASRRGLVYVSDAHARAAGSGHPAGALWDSGDDPVASLRHHLQVRRIALDRFATRALPPGRPRAELRERFVPIYLFHRYQLEAAAKLVGGLWFNYGTADDGSPASRPVRAARQWDALDAVLEALTPDALDVPDDLLAALDPHEPSHLAPGVARELFEPALEPAFDVSRAADAAATIALGALLHRDRLARVDELHARDRTLPSVDELLSRVTSRIAPSRRRDAPRRDRLIRVVQHRLVEQLSGLATNDDAAWRVRAAAARALERIGRGVDDEGGDGAWLARRARAALAALDEPLTTRPADPVVPPGSPIGACGDWL